MKMNLPNKLTVLRMIMIPFFMFIIMFPVLGIFWSRIVAALLFGLTALTDMLDGKIARKHNLVTDFGKFMDPVADKLMTIGGYIALLSTISNENDKVFYMIFAWATFVVILREIAVTSLRMIVSNKSGGVLAAAILGKIKTVSQIVCILVMILEPAFFGNTFIGQYHILSYVTVAFMVFMTIWSGLDYVKAYWPLLDPEK